MLFRMPDIAIRLEDTHFTSKRLRYLHVDFYVLRDDGEESTESIDETFIDAMDVTYVVEVTVHEL